MNALQNLPSGGRGLLTPGAGGGEAPDAGVARPAGESATQSSGPAHFVSTPESRAAGRIPFTCAYWSYLRREILEEPLAADHGLEEIDAEVLRRQCNYNYDQQVFARGREQNRALHAGKGAK